LTIPYCSGCGRRAPAKEETAVLHMISVKNLMPNLALADGWAG
jgi:hypothetical protein